MIIYTPPLVLQQELRRLKEELGIAKTSQNVDYGVSKDLEYSNPGPLHINERGTLSFESRKLFETRTDTDSRVVSFEVMR